MRALMLPACLLVAGVALGGAPGESVRVPDMTAAEMMEAEHALRTKPLPAKATAWRSEIGPAPEPSGAGEPPQPATERPPPAETSRAEAGRAAHSVTIRKDRELQEVRRPAGIREAGSVRQYLDEVIAVDLVDEPFEVILQSVVPLGWSSRIQVKRPGFSEKVFSITAENRRGEILATIQRSTGVRFNLYPSLYLVLVTD